MHLCGGKNSLNLKSMDWLDWLSSKLQEHPCPSVPLRIEVVAAVPLCTNAVWSEPLAQVLP